MCCPSQPICLQLAPVGDDNCELYATRAGFKLVQGGLSFWNFRLQSDILYSIFRQGSEHICYVVSVSWSVVQEHVI